MSDLYVIPIIHLGQSPGTSEKRLEQYALRVVDPLADQLAAASGVRFGLHITGWLLKWFAQRQGAVLKKLTALVAAGRAEVLGGGWTDPFLSGLPDADAQGQLQLQSKLVERWIRRRPEGLWLPRCAWDPSLPRLMVKNNFRYAAVDEGAFAAAGLQPEDVGSHLRTERAGSGVELLPAVSDPIGLLEDFQGGLLARQEGGARLVCWALSLERQLGQAHWTQLAGAFEALSTEHWLKPLTPGEAVQHVPSAGRVYPPPWIPSSLHPSTARMPPDGVGRPAPSVGWEGFLARYGECNRLHKRMILVSTQLGRLRAALRAGKSNRRDALEGATEALYKAQAAELYLHGDRAGFYDPSLRHLAYAELDRAELSIRTALGEREKLGRLRADLNCDGAEEVLIKTVDLRAVVSPARGGSLASLDLWALPGNILNTMTRRPEPYHEPLDALSGLPALVVSDGEDAEEDSEDGEADGDDTEALARPAAAAPPPTAEQLALARNLHYDRAERLSFVDHFLDDSLTLDNTVNGRPPELGDYATGRYRLLSVEPHEILDACVVQMTREGHVTRGRVTSLVQVAKRFIFHRDLPVIDARYEVTNRSHTPMETTFAIELNLGLDARFARGARISGGGGALTSAAAGVLEGVRQLTIADPRKRFQLVLDASVAMRVYAYPVVCGVQVGASIKPVSQGVCLMLIWPLRLWGHEKAAFDMSLNLEVG